MKKLLQVPWSWMVTSFGETWVVTDDEDAQVICEVDVEEEHAQAMAQTIARLPKLLKAARLAQSVLQEMHTTPPPSWPDGEDEWGEDNAKVFGPFYRTTEEWDGPNYEGAYVAWPDLKLALDELANALEGVLT